MICSIFHSSAFCKQLRECSHHCFLSPFEKNQIKKVITKQTAFNTLNVTFRGDCGTLKTGSFCRCFSMESAVCGLKMTGDPVVSVFRSRSSEIPGASDPGAEEQMVEMFLFKREQADRIPEGFLVQMKIK